MPQKNEIPPPKKCGTAIHESVEIGAEKMSVILKADIKRKLKEIGLESGDNVIVHTSLKSMGYVCDGAQAVIEALIETVGENGTIMMPTQSWKNLDPETGVHGEVDEKDWPLIRENWPAYDKKNDADQHDGRGGGDVSTVAGERSQRSSGALHLRMGKERGISDAKP